MELIRADWIDDGEALHRGAALLIDRDGLIAEIGAADELLAKHQGKVLITDWRGHGLAPGCVNAHSHCFQVFLRGRADHPKNFADWVSGHLYPSVQKLEDRALEIAAILAFAQMARAGVTSVGEFHYIHNAPDGSAGGSRIDALVLDAARRIGLRTAFLRCLYDSRKRPGQERFAESVSEAQAATRELAKKVARDTMASVLPAPHSLHGASAEMIQAGHELAKELNSTFHIHLAEQQSDIAFAKERYGCSPLRALDKLGVLDERCVLVHGLWLDDGEIELLAERGGALVYNPTTNMTLGDGIGPIEKLQAAGVPVALGTDANYSLSIFAEMRATEQLQRATKLRMGVLTGQAGNARPLLDMGRKNASRSLGLKTGRLALGLPADLIAIDLSDPSLLPASVRSGDHEVLNAMVSAMVPETAIRHVLVQGQRIVTHGELVAFAQDELAELVAEVC